MKTCRNMVRKLDEEVKKEIRKDHEKFSNYINSQWEVQQEVKDELTKRYKRAMVKFYLKGWKAGEMKENEESEKEYHSMIHKHNEYILDKLVEDLPESKLVFILGLHNNMLHKIHFLGRVKYQLYDSRKKLDNRD